jgi:hypothetical protein
MVDQNLSTYCLLCSFTFDLVNGIANLIVKFETRVFPVILSFSAQAWTLHSLGIDDTQRPICL